MTVASEPPVDLPFATKHHGRAKGSRDKYPRYQQQFRQLSKLTYAHIIDLVRLAPAGRELDKIAILRAAQVAILGHLVGELDKPDMDRRREVQASVFRILHDAEIETIKAMPDMATLVGPGKPVPAGEGTPGDIVALHLPTFKAHKVDQDD